MVPGTGYYFYNSSSLSSLKLYYNTGGTLSKTTANNVIEQYKNSDIVVSISNGSTVYGEVSLGVNESAKDDYDSLDYFAAPEGFEKAE